MPPRTQATRTRTAQGGSPEDATAGAAAAQGGAPGRQPGAGDAAAPGSRRTRTLLLATGGVGVLVVAGVTIGTLGASGSAGHATTVSDRQSGAPRGPPRRCRSSP